MSNWVPVAAIVAAVLLVGIPAIVTDGFGLFGSSEATPLDLAQEYMETRNARDVDRILELYSANATMADTPPVSNLSELPLFLEIERQFELEFSPYECVVNPDNEDVVICSYQLESRLQRIQGLGPASGEIWVFVDAGEITLTSHVVPEGLVAAWDSFGRFLDGQGVFYDIYRRDERGPILTPEAVALHGEYLDLWEQRRTGE